MRTIKERLSKKLGYMPSDYEIVTMYQNGILNLTNSEENEIINYIYNTN
jgi:predicted Zn-dependent protease with MMP-like domain